MSEGKPISRRTFLRAASSVASIPLVLLLSACGSSPPKPIKKIEIVTVTPETRAFHPVSIISVSTESEFSRLPAVEKIKIIESTDKKIQIKNEQFEYAKALAEFYCEQTGKGTDEALLIAKKINFVDSEEYKEQYKAESLRINIAEPQDSLGFSAQNKSGIWINYAEIQAVINENSSNESEIFKILANSHKLPKWFLMREIILHEIAHFGGKLVDFYFGLNVPVNIENPIDKTTYMFTNIENKDVYGMQNGKQVVARTGEAMSELVAIILSGRIDSLTLPIKAYFPGANILYKISQAAGISENEMIDFTQGNKSLIDMLSHWAKLKDRYNTSMNEALMAYVLVGLVINGTVSAKEAIAEINNALNIKLSL